MIRPLSFKNMASVGILMVIVLVLDLMFPLGVAAGVLYIAPVLLSGTISKIRYIFLTASVSSLLVVIGYQASPDGGIEWVVLTNRLISLFAIWVTAAILLYVIRNDETLAKSERELHSFLDATLDRAALVEKDGTFVVANRSMTEFFNPDERNADGELVGKSMFKKPFTETGKRRMDWLSRVVETGELIHEVDEHEERIYDNRYYPVKDRKGRVVRIALSVRDITEEKRAEQDLVEARNFAEKASRAKSEFMASMSHELRTPLNAILGFAQLLDNNMAEPLSERQKKHVSLIMRSGNDLLDMVNQVLDLNQIETGQSNLQFEQVPIQQIIDSCFSENRERANELNVELIDRVAGKEQGMLHSNGTYLARVLNSLLSNGIKYNKDGGQVIVSCQNKEEKVLRILVTDTGIGIPLDQQREIFKPFERIGHEYGVIKGVGIGLTIAQKTIELLGGNIGFESIEGQGSTFWIEVPFIDAYAQEF